MNQKGKQKEIANKIKKWLKAAIELSQEKIIVAIPITRLTSIKSLCSQETAAQQFALYLSQQVQQQMNQAERFEELTLEEWSAHKSLVADAISLQENHLETPTSEGKQSIRGLLRKIDKERVAGFTGS